MQLEVLIPLLSLQLFSIYAAGNTVPIPFLRATDISPIALLSDNVLGGMQRDNDGTIAVEALQELFTGDGQSKKGRRGQNEVLSLLLFPCLSACVNVFLCVIYGYLLIYLMCCRCLFLLVYIKGSLPVQP